MPNAPGASLRLRYGANATDGTRAVSPFRHSPPHTQSLTYPLPLFRSEAKSQRRNGPSASLSGCAFSVARRHDSPGCTSTFDLFFEVFAVPLGELDKLR